MKPTCPFPSSLEERRHLVEFLEGLQTLHADAEAAGECEASADFLAQLAQRLEGRGQDEVFDADGLALVDDASEVLAVRLAHLLEDVDLNSQHGLHGRLLLHLRLLSSLKEKQHLGDEELSLVVLDLVDRVYPRGLHFEGLLDCVFLELLSLKEEGGEGEERETSFSSTASGLLFRDVENVSLSTTI